MVVKAAHASADHRFGEASPVVGGKGGNHPVAGSGVLFFFSSRRRHTRLQGDWSSDVCSSDLPGPVSFFVAGLVSCEWHETNQKHELRLELLDADGGSVPHPENGQPVATSATFEDRKSVV